MPAETPSPAKHASSSLSLRSQLPAPGPQRSDCVLGIDPGTRAVGFGAIRITPAGPRLLGAGVLRPPTGSDVPTRLAHVRVGLDRLIEELRPAVVAVEMAFASRNVQSALRIGEGRGVVLAAAAGSGALVVQFTPATVKKALVGNGQAHKSQVAAMVARLLQLDEAPRLMDASDALALALTHMLRGRLLQER